MGSTLGKQIGKRGDDLAKLDICQTIFVDQYLSQINHISGKL